MVEKTTIAALIVGALLVLGGLYYYTSENANNGNTNTNKNNSNPVELTAVISINQSSFSAKVGQEVEFSAESSTGPIVTYDWDFGDGSTDSGITVTHKFTEAGVYNITLNVSDGKGHYANDIRKMSIVSKGTEQSSVPVAQMTAIYSSGTILGTPRYTITIVTIDPQTNRDNVTFYLMDNTTGEKKYEGNISQLKTTSSPVAYIDTPAMGVMNQGDSILLDEDLGNVTADPGDIFVLEFYTGDIIGFVQLKK